jgi:penicillin-binding protein 2
MFHRRLVLLLTLMLCATAGLSAQLFRLTVIDGPRHRADAEESLQTRSLLPTVRGRIFDGKGRVLAEDRPCYGVSVDYAVINGQWAYDQARKIAWHENSARWVQMDFDDREEVIAQYREPFDSQLERLWAKLCELGGIDRFELERRKQTIIQRVQTIRSDVWDRLAKRRAAETSGPVELSEVAVPVSEEQEAHTLLPAVADDAAFQFRKLIGTLPGLHVERSRTRDYNNASFEVKVDRETLPSPIRSTEPFVATVHSAVATLVGAMGDAQAEHVAERPFHIPAKPPDLGGYLPGDLVGLRGVERYEEQRLRGKRGEMLTRLDTGNVERVASIAGQDVHLTIDVALQARMAALLDPGLGLMSVQAWHHNNDTPLGTPLYGTAMVIEVDSGNVLAMVSTPMPADPLPDSSVELESQPAVLADGESTVNKAIAAVYPPGSTLKPIVYTIAVANKSIGVDQQVDCEGVLFADKPNVFRCWGWRPGEGRFLRHGPLSPPEAIARSCNIYFYTCGKNLGPKPLVSGLESWGFGRLTGLGLPEEVEGQMPSLTKPNPPGRELSTSNAINMGIGQGPIAVPPIQVAVAHAALARGGYYLSPILIRERADKQESRDLNVPAPAVKNALQGMFESANADYGTANHMTFDGAVEKILSIPNLVVRAKTGTAQASPRKDKDGQVTRAGEHSWFVVHAQKPGDERAKFVVVVMVEYGGSGGRVSGPIANQVLYALRAEGYL